VRPGVSITSFCIAIGVALLTAFPASAQLGNNAPGWFLIGSISANNSASLQFTGATWSTSYNTLFLNCQGLFGSASGEYLAMQVGESTPTTWKTTAHYVQISADGAGLSDILSNEVLGMTTTGAPTYLQAYIDNPGSSTVKKMIDVFIGGGITTTAVQGGGGTFVASTCCGYDYAAFSDTAGVGANFWSNSGYWTNDTNALTGIELVPSSGTIASGTCSLYGLQ
jgi:hypothetical protein